MNQQLDLFSARTGHNGILTVDPYNNVHQQRNALNAEIKPLSSQPMPGHGQGQETDRAVPARSQDMPSAGERLKVEGQNAVEAHNAAWVEWIRGVARSICRRHGRVSTDDLRTICNTHSRQPYHPNAWGTVFRGSEWAEVGRKKSETESCHAREIRIWALADTANNSGYLRTTAGRT